MRRPVARWLVVSSVAATVALSGLLLRPGRSQDKVSPENAPAAVAGPEAEPTIDPLSVNATCYICHTMFVWEEISKQHLAEEVTCIECHGLSAGHANDEDVGATKPDLVYGRAQIDAMCRECHTGHDVQPRDVIARFLERKLTLSPAVCTDCHGKHRIEAAELEEKEEEQEKVGKRGEEIEPRRRGGAEKCAGWGIQGTRSDDLCMAQALRRLSAPPRLRGSIYS